MLLSKLQKTVFSIIGWILLFVFMGFTINSCKSSNKDNPKNPTKQEVTDEICKSIHDSLVQDLRIKYDSILDAELTYIETNEDMVKELELLKKAYDSIMDSNDNLRRYIKHQDNMIGPNKKQPVK